MKSSEQASQQRGLVVTGSPFLSKLAVDFKTLSYVSRKFPTLTLSLELCIFESSFTKC